MTTAARKLIYQTLVVASFAVLLFVLGTCSPPISKLAQIRVLGTLKVATINSPTTFYDSGDGPTGFSYDLSKRFAQALGVELDMRIAPSAAAALQAVSDQQVHLAAANLTITDNRSRHILFSPAVREVTPQLVYHMGSGLKRNALDKIKRPISVPQGSSYEERLHALQKDHPNLKLDVLEDVSSEDLLARVGQGTLAYSAGDSDLVAMTKRYHHNLGTMLDLDTPSRKAWAFRKHRDSSLFNEATRFLTQLEDSGELAILNDRYFGHVDRLDFVSSRSLSQHIDDRLPRYRKLFEKAARDTGIDWRLLAAISYQESHWNAAAQSRTGVRGLMMLTRDTAKFMKVKNRRNPAQSIDGGARYFRFLLDRLPDEIKQPDRIWMALASYNMGYGHLLDVRKLTKLRGGNPNSWIDVRSNLRLLTQAKWHRKTKYGYARGHEAEMYVGNVRTYLDVLNWMTRSEQDQKNAELASPKPSGKVVPEATSPLDMKLPVL